MKALRTFLGLILAVSLSSTAAAPAYAADGAQQFANLGECKLDSGEMIKECRIGYRTLGALNADKSNAVVILLPVWEENDQSSDTLPNEANWVDPSKHFIIVIDPLANKVSIGPDNSKTQPGAKFPKVSIRDMVEINRRVLKEALKLDRVYAIMGEQLGGMQALEWMVAYPNEMDKVIAIATTPKPDDWDIMAWQGQVDMLSRPRATQIDDVAAAMAAGSSLALMIGGPPHRAQATAKWVGGPRGALGYMQTFLLGYGLDRWERYARAIVGHDIYRMFGGSPQKAAAATKAKLLAMVLPDDQFTSAEPLLNLAKLMNAKVVTLSNDQVQSWIGGDGNLIRKELRAFLNN